MASKIDKENIIKLGECLKAIVICYAPLNEEEIIAKMKEYFKSVYNMYKDQWIASILKGMCDARQLICKDGYYSIIEIEDMDELQDKIFNIKEEKKFKNGKELFRYHDLSKLDGIEEFDMLKQYVLLLEVKNNKEEEVMFTLATMSYMMVDNDIVYEYLKKNVKKKVDYDVLNTLMFKYGSIIPRPFLKGYNLQEYMEQSELVQKADDFFSDKYEIKHYPKKTDYKTFTYEDCIKLAKQLNRSELFKIIDSDRVLELTINGNKVYVSVLGFYNKDIGIIIYKNWKEMLYTYSFLLGRQEEFPDLALRPCNIEVNLREPAGFLTEDVLDELNQHKYPECPSFVRLEANAVPRLINEEEIQLVGGVLSDLVKLPQLCNLSDIKNNLGEKKNDMPNVNQVYVGDDEVAFGYFNDPAFGDFLLNFKPEHLNKNLFNQLKKFPKHSINIGVYIMNACENGKLPYCIFVKDNDTGLMIDMFLRHKEEMGNVVNDVLNIFKEHKIYPRDIGVNNEYTYEIFGELGDLLDEYLIDDENREMDDIYMELYAMNEKGDGEETYFS